MAEDYKGIPSNDFTIKLPPPQDSLVRLRSERMKNQIEKQIEQDKFNKEVLENQREILESLRLVQNQLNSQQKALEKLESAQSQLKELETQKDPIAEPVKKPETDVRSSREQPESAEPRYVKQFVLRHTFKNMSRMRLGDTSYSSSEEYFGVQWRISTSKKNGTITLFLHCKHTSEKLWSVWANYDLKLINPRGPVYTLTSRYIYVKDMGFGYLEFIKWNDLERNYLVDDEMRVEAHVRVTKLSGVYKVNLRSFDESMREFSDIVLTVNDQKFYVAKLFLATHSTYFKAILLGKFGDSKQSEITLTGIDPDDFQKYLEVLYGNSKALDEFNVEGILLIAGMYDTPVVIEKCEDFLVEKSKKSLKKKLQMAARYSLETLKKKCLGLIETIDDIRSVTTEDIQDMDPSLISLLFKKSISLN